jgi:hypothetical protein
LDAHDIDNLIDDRQAQFAVDPFDQPWEDGDIGQPYAVALAFAVLASLVAIAATSVTATVVIGIWRLFN